MNTRLPVFVSLFVESLSGLFVGEPLSQHTPPNLLMEELPHAIIKKPVGATPSGGWEGRIGFQLILCTLLLSLSFNLNAQQNPIQPYIAEALESNIALQRQELSYNKSLAALKEAKGLFFPKLSIEARYSVAKRGRAFEIPIGDLMNPVYNNLNLINSFGQSASPDYPVIPEYPQIENTQVNFLRETEHETKVRVAMPVFNTAILQNHRIKQNMVEAEKISVGIYKRELVKEVKAAYYNYAKAAQAVILFNNTLDLVNENLRTTESLHRNHKVTIDVVYAAKAEVEEVNQQLAEAEKNTNIAQAYFNFMLNRDYNSPIDLMADSALPQSVLSLEAARQQALSNREELQQLNYYLAISDNNIQLNKNSHLPNINLVADYGFQGTHYRFSSEDDFAMGSLVLSWNLFDKTTKARVQQAKIEKNEVAQHKNEVYQQIGLQVVNTFYDLEAAQKSILSAEAEVDAAQKAFRLVNKKYSQGQANLVEFTNARTQLTNAEQKLIIAKYDYQVKLANFERATAGYIFE